MKLAILSDLHLEFFSDHGKAFIASLPVLAKTLILAGDTTLLSSPQRAHSTYSWFCDRYKHVVAVLGNHEYYGSSPELVHEIVNNLKIPNLHILNPGTVEIEGQRFVGATLWFPETPDEYRYRGELNDFRVIKNFVPWVHQAHQTDLTYLTSNVRPGDVVVTHHLPHPICVAPQYRGSSLNRFFLAEDAQGIVGRAGAKLWVYGHTHTPGDVAVEGTRLLCNPKGYPHETGTLFNRELVVEV